MDLLKCREIGIKWCGVFKEEYFKDGTRFTKPIKRRKIRNFRSDALKIRISTKDNNIQELQGTRDLFGHLLHLAVTKGVDLTTVLAYPRTPVPLSLGHVDGSVNKTDKSTLMKNLANRIDTVGAVEVDMCIIDVGFLIRSQVNLPSTYGGLASAILSRIIGLAQRVDFICDTYSDRPSIKDMEHTAWSSDAQTLFTVSGPEQKRPKEFQALLDSSPFKRVLLQFLADEWQKTIYSDQICGNQLYAGLGDKAWLYETHVYVIIRVEVPQLICEHEEADTQIVWHIRYICQTQPGCNITIQCDDTDVLVILLAQNENAVGHIWMEVGKSTNNTRRYIDVSSLATHLGVDVCNALPVPTCIRMK